MFVGFLYVQENLYVEKRNGKELDSMKLGIVGLPNVGKSTLFNSLTKAGAESANYPFCTIDPNVGVVPVPDERLDVLTKMHESKKTVPAVIEFVDIAGLVKGASKGEGLGNQFLSNIREVDAIVHVVRCFEDTNIVHVDGSMPGSSEWHRPVPGEYLPGLVSDILPRCNKSSAYHLLPVQYRKTHHSDHILWLETVRFPDTPSAPDPH